MIPFSIFNYNNKSSGNNLLHIDRIHSIILSKIQDIIKYLTLLFYILMLLSTASSASEYRSEQKSYKLQKIDKKIAFPSDIAFFNGSGEKQFIEDYEGKTLLIVFWATWCAPCANEMIELDILKKDFRKLPIEILPISQDFSGMDTVKNFYEQNDIRYLPPYHDYKNELFRELRAAGLPTCYIVDRDGFIKMIIKGSISWNEDSIRTMLLEYIEGNPPLPKNSYKDTSLNHSIKIHNQKKEDKKTDSTTKQEDSINKNEEQNDRK